MGEMEYGNEYSVSLMKLWQFQNQYRSSNENIFSSCNHQEKSYYSDSGDMDYSNNGFESSGVLNASSNSISIDLSPGNTVSRDSGYVSSLQH